jgi:hypothetical protein
MELSRSTSKRFVYRNFGGLHIEINILKGLGDKMKESEWDELHVQADGTRTGRADAILKGSHVTRSC